jgi:hypothetical protein
LKCDFIYNISIGVNTAQEHRPMVFPYTLWSSQIGDVQPSLLNDSFAPDSIMVTALTTVGAGTITAAGVAGGVTTRSGSTSAFTDTTDTAANIIAAVWGSAALIGDTDEYTYVNNTVAAATLTGGTGVTVSGATVVPPNSWVKYLVTYTAAATVTMVAVEQGYFPKSGTFTALTGGGPVTVANAAVTATSQVLITLKTVGGTVTVGGPYIATITPGTGFTVTNGSGDTSVYNYAILG